MHKYIMGLGIESSFCYIGNVSTHSGGNISRCYNNSSKKLKVGIVMHASHFHIPSMS